MDSLIYISALIWLSTLSNRQQSCNRNEFKLGSQDKHCKILGETWACFRARKQSLSNSDREMWKWVWHTLSREFKRSVMYCCHYYHLFLRWAVLSWARHSVCTPTDLIWRQNTIIWHTLYCTLCYIIFNWVLCDRNPYTSTVPFTLHFVP